MFTERCIFLSVKVKIPHIYWQLTGGKKEIFVKPGLLKDIFSEIKETYPELSEVILDENNHIKGSIMLFLDKRSINNPKKIDSYIKDNQILSLIIPMSGG